MPKTKSLNERVAVEVMGWKLLAWAPRGETPFPQWVQDGIFSRLRGAWRPDSVIDDAFQVVEKMHSKGLDLELIYDSTRPSPRYYAVFGGDRREPLLAEDEPWGVAKTAPEAICLAALEAMKK